MVTEKQLAANRRNALKGGVKTAAGKKRVRFNAVKHGLMAREIVLRHENAAAFEELREGLHADINPQGTHEKTLVDLIAAEYWRLWRAIDLETRYISGEIIHLQVRASKHGSSRSCSETRYYLDVITGEMDECNEHKILDNINRYKTRIQRQLSGHLRDLEYHQNRKVIAIAQITPESASN